MLEINSLELIKNHLRELDKIADVDGFEEDSISVSINEFGLEKKLKTSSVDFRNYNFKIKHNWVEYEVCLTKNYIMLEVYDKIDNKILLNTSTEPDAECLKLYHTLSEYCYFKGYGK